jgi:Tol biopolymer transport system component
MCVKTLTSSSLKLGRVKKQRPDESFSPAPRERKERMMSAKRIFSRATKLAGERSVVLRLVLVAGLIAVVGLLVGVYVQPAQATFPGVPGKIAYGNDVGRVPQHSEIFTINPDGTGKFKVTNNNSRDDVDPSYSPDGTRIAYGSSGGGDYEIYTINAKGGGRVRLTNNSTDDRWPSYSPDGTRIVYAAFDGHGDYEIYTMDAKDGGGKVRLTNNPTDDISPSYSPDGTRIAYVHEDSLSSGGDNEIYTMKAGGGDKIRITDNAKEDLSPSYSPDGTRIAYDSGESDYRTQLYTMKASGGGKVQLTKSDERAFNGEPSYSPDGTRIAYVHATPSDYNQICTIRVSGSRDRREVITWVTRDAAPSWGSR